MTLTLAEQGFRRIKDVLPPDGAWCKVIPNGGTYQELEWSGFFGCWLDENDSQIKAHGRDLWLEQ